MTTKRKTPAKKPPARKTPAKKAPAKRSRRAGVNSKDQGDFPLWVFEAVTARDWLSQIESRIDKVLARGDKNPHFKEAGAEMKRARTAVVKAVAALKPVQTVVDKLSA